MKIRWMKRADADYMGYKLSAVQLNYGLERYRATIDGELVGVFRTLDAAMGACVKEAMLIEHRRVADKLYRDSVGMP